MASDRALASESTFLYTETSTSELSPNHSSIGRSYSCNCRHMSVERASRKVDCSTCTPVVSNHQCVVEGGCFPANRQGVSDPGGWAGNGFLGRSSRSPDCPRQAAASQTGWPSRNLSSAVIRSRIRPSVMSSRGERPPNASSGDDSHSFSFEATT